MPAVARGDGTDSVFSLTGSGFQCLSPIGTSTNECSGDVFCNAIGVVRAGDKVAPHPAAGCGPDTSGLTTFSSTVFVNGRGCGRLGDQYTPDNTITSGSPNVFAGG
jgi:uncharacterized Zn-binding protein involved in type VI secretion